VYLTGREPIVQVPELTHLQFLIVGFLLGGERTGPELRQELHSFRVRHSTPAFYQLMARMEDLGLVQGRYQQRLIRAQLFRERRYQVTAAGRAAWRASREFYAKAVARLALPPDPASE
jgi:DNA-binding PadR family transcriptional regulator